MVKSPMFSAQNDIGTRNISELPSWHSFSIEALLKQDMFLLGPAGPLLRHRKSSNPFAIPQNDHLIWKMMIKMIKMFNQRI